MRTALGVLGALMVGLVAGVVAFLAVAYSSGDIVAWGEGDLDTFWAAAAAGTLTFAAVTTWALVRDHRRRNPDSDRTIPS